MLTPLTPLRCLHRAMDLFGDSLGVVDGDKRFTYAEFGERCQRLASALARRGIASGDRVGYLSLNNHQLLEGYFGVPQAGGIVMPLNVRLSPPDLGYILNHSGAKMLMYGAPLAPLVQALRSTCPAIETFVALDGPAEDALRYEELIGEGKPERADIYKIDENSIAELFYTSGSTGRPKGVMLSHRTLYLHALSVMTLFTQVESMVYLHAIPFFHANGWGMPQACTYRGIPQVMVNRFDPNLIFSQIEQHQGTDMYLVPAMANGLLACPERGNYDLSSLRRIFIGGAASSPSLVERVEAGLGCQCISGYGLTETSPVLATSLEKRATEFPSDEERYRRQAMTGYPVIGNEVRVVDEAGNPVPKDGKTMGEIVCRGDHVMDGYFNEPQQTAEAMVGGWFHTGDMAVWDEAGCLTIVDRKKEIIISGGENISSLEIEKAIAALPGVFECAVVAAPDDKWGEVPAAIVVARQDATLDPEGIRKALAGSLAKFQMPKIIEIRTEPLPKSGTGKIKKMELREAFWQGKQKRVQG